MTTGFLVWKIVRMPVEDALRHRLELGAAMIHRRHVHGAQHAVGHVGRSRNLQEMPAGFVGHDGVSRGRGARPTVSLLDARVADADVPSCRSNWIMNSLFVSSDRSQDRGRRGRPHGGDDPAGPGAAAGEREIAGEVCSTASSRGRYATDASIYQIMPAGVVVARSRRRRRGGARRRREEGVPLTMRGGGTSQCGQTVNSGLIVDTSKHLNRCSSSTSPGAGARWSSRGSCSTSSTGC